MTSKQHDCMDNYPYIIYRAIAGNWNIINAYIELDEGIMHIKYCPFCGIKLEE